MKKENRDAMNYVKSQVKILAGFDEALLCSAVANLYKDIVVGIAKAAEEAEGNYKALTVKNPRTKWEALEGIVRDDWLMDQLCQYGQKALGPIYNMVHYIQSTKFGNGTTAAEERAERRAEGEALAGTSKARRRGRGIVINDAFEAECYNLGYDPDNLSPEEEEEVMRRVGYIN